MYAQPVKRMSQSEKYDAIRAGREFASDMDKEFVGIEKAHKGGWCAVMTCDDGSEAAASVVKCPECGSIQVCWGEYGDPETEQCDCTGCKQEYHMEPF